MSYIVLNWTNPPTVRGKPGKKSSIVLNAYSVAVPSVTSVNGQRGVVVLGPADVNADAAGSADAVRTDLTAGLNLKLDVVDYVQHFWAFLLAIQHSLQRTPQPWMVTMRRSIVGLVLSV